MRYQWKWIIFHSKNFHIFPKAQVTSRKKKHNYADTILRSRYSCNLELSVFSMTKNMTKDSL